MKKRLQFGSHNKILTRKYKTLNIIKPQNGILCYRTAAVDTRIIVHMSYAHTSDDQKKNALNPREEKAPKATSRNSASDHGHCSALFLSNCI